MGALLKLALTIYIVSLIISMIGAFIKFVADTHKWHDREERVHITKSAFESDLEEPEKPIDVTKESEVIENDTERDKHNTSAFSIFGR